jgi:DNA-binding CsgD family transcriptional regulator
MPEHRARLTDREQQVLDLVAAGIPTRAIAGVLGISVASVKANLSRIFRKLGVSNRAQAIAVALGPAQPATSLTDRQAMVLQLVSQGRTTEQIAAELDLSASGVRYHLRAAYQKLGANTRYEALSRLHAGPERSNSVASS